MCGIHVKDAQPLITFVRFNHKRERGCVRRIPKRLDVGHDLARRGSLLASLRIR